MKFIKSNNTYKQKFYNVEFIITRRIKGKKKLYLIKWEGYPITGCSWEPISHLTNIKDMVKEFDDNFPNSINHKYLKEFKLELKKYKHHKNHKKTEKNKTKLKTPQSNKIIIELDDIDFNSINNEKEKEETNIESDIKVEKLDNETKIELIEKTNDNCINDYFKNDGKLIKPILIW